MESHCQIDHGPRTASAPAAGGRKPCPARGPRGGARTQPRRTDGMIDDEGTHRRVGGLGSVDQPRCGVATPRVGPRRRREPFEHDSRTASGAAGRPAGGSPGVRPPGRVVGPPGEIPRRGTRSSPPARRGDRRTLPRTLLTSRPPPCARPCPYRPAQASSRNVADAELAGFGGWSSSPRGARPM